MKVLLLVLALSFSFGGSSAAAQGVDLDAFIKQDEFGSIKISPTGEFYAATVPYEDRTVLVVIRREDNKVTATFRMGADRHVSNFWWVNPGRVLISLAEKNGSLDQPQSTGELYGMDAVGGEAEILVGYRLRDNALGSRRGSNQEAVVAYLVDDLPGDQDSVVVSVTGLSEDALSRAERMDVHTGKRWPLAKAPMRWARFLTDNKGDVRFTFGSGDDNVNKLYYRRDEAQAWKLINDEGVSGRIETPLGFSADDRVAYLQVEQPQGPDVIEALDVASGTRSIIARDPVAEPYALRYGVLSGVPIGAMFMAGKPRNVFFDPGSADAKLYASLQQALAGQMVFVTSATSDGRLALVSASSDRNTGDFYLFDTRAKKAELVLSRRSWLDPEAMAPMQAIELRARDGLTLHGFLTLPPDGAGTNLPMVVLPHGGPFGVFDVWGFSNEPQMLAQAGYAVLQVNFRGSGNYGRAFRIAGARQWGRSMQDDVTDATRWAIDQGIADAGRICIYGASYGAYAALMGLVREPQMYKCAVGYVGVYDLELMHAQDSQSGESSKIFLQHWVGEREALDAVSPNLLAERIKAPVFLAAGGEDDRAPIKHSRRMESALHKAGVPVETLFYATEGHGFYTEPHRREYYTRLLDFLSRHIGGAKAK